MTTIEPRIQCHKLTIEPNLNFEDGSITHIIIEGHGERIACGGFPTADLLAALDAVPKMPEKPPLADRERDLLGPQNDDGRYWHRRAMENLRKAELATTRAEKAEAERDALAAGAERVRAWAEDYFGVLDEAPDELRAALDPKPAFELPTEAGISFTAKNGIGEEVTFCSVWNITKDGDAVLYVNNRDYLYNGDDILKIFTGHRLLGGAE